MMCDYQIIHEENTRASGKAALGSCFEGDLIAQWILERVPIDRRKRFWMDGWEGMIRLSKRMEQREACGRKPKGKLRGAYQLVPKAVKYISSCENAAAMQNGALPTPASPPVLASCVWWPPGEKPAFLDYLGSGLFWVGLKMRGLHAALRFFALYSQLEELRKQICPQPHYYLQFIGVKKCDQRSGLATLLMRHSLGVIDHEGYPCYLENSNPAAVPFFVKLGFEVVKVVRCGHGGPPISIMVRRARPKLQIMLEQSHPESDPPALTKNLLQETASKIKESFYLKYVFVPALILIFIVVTFFAILSII